MAYLSEAGGVATEVTVLDPSRQEIQHVQPTFLPDGRHFIYFRHGSAENTGIFVGSLDVKPADQYGECALVRRGANLITFWR